MKWPLPISLIFLVVTCSLPGCISEASVGCLFSERLCSEDEFCFNDNAFGRCLQNVGNLNPEELYKFSLEREVLHELSSELRRLFALGYRWSHSYTQCRLQALLYAYQYDLTFEQNECTHLIDQDLEGALKALEGQVELEPQEVAIIKYTPSVDDPHARFADEVYYPPVDNAAQRALREKILQPDAIDILDMEDPYADYQLLKRSWQFKKDKRSTPQFFSEDYNTPTGFRLGKETRDSNVLYFLPESDFNHYDNARTREFEDLYPLIKFLQNNNMKSEQLTEFMSPKNLEYLLSMMQYYKNDEDLNNIPQERFALNYNTPDNFRAGWESRELIEDYPDRQVYIDDSNDIPTQILQDSIQQKAAEDELFREQTLKTLPFNNDKDESTPGVYTEGGVVYPKDKDWKGQLDSLLQHYNLGFKRPERLDVKKPGPPFNTAEKLSNGEDILLPNMMKKEPRGMHPNPVHDVPEDDFEYVHVELKNELDTWRQGSEIQNNISKLLGLSSNAFIDGRVDPKALIFRLQPGYNITDIAKKIDGIKDELKALTGVEIVSSGVGDKNNMHTALSTTISKTNQFYIVLFMVCGVLAAMIVAALLLIIIKKSIKTRNKVQSFGRSDAEASKDYEDLCRVKMATKCQAGERITSLSKESEQSPSSRSSTSSWSEEPALHNMDISTGHMVLTYMEDHLKNKDRLEQEWVALCAYMAEPCETTIACKKGNTERNRYPEIVPYDHARLVLNELSNLNASDYINASSITDHDPRNPVYIATQGPIPSTSADFWQMIWEQGAVVIVMLTRLTESGAAMCHRYWPEEGSELYHIYEVHLVSEHFWCDDYLVRSFYLKNVRTGETRTVTQFHFLSWPEAGVPASTKALLEFRRKVNKSYRGRSCPIVVHCSDGAGRTGTYCLIDMVLSRMAKGAKEIDIAATLEHLRDQRPRMVATKQQFEFVLTAVAEEVHAILKALPPTTVTADKDKEKEKP